MTTKKVQPWRLAALAVATSLALTACGNKEGDQKAAAAQQAPAPVVGVVTVQPQNVLMDTDLPGRLESVRTAVIVPQVSGIVKRRLFDEGSFVKAGQPLYLLDDASYAASEESARASLASAQAALAKAQADVARYRPLVAADAISKQDWDAALSAQRSAEASVQSAIAAIKSAQVNVRHAHITAPISGYIGQSSVTEGALVMANSTQMATIQQNDPLYINITQSANDMLKLRRQLAEGKMAMNDRIAVDVVLEDGSTYEHKAQLLFADPSVNESTGQVTMRAIVPNPDRLLMSGLYVRAKIPLAGYLDVFVVPQQAVTRGKADTVNIVNAAGEMEARTVKIAAQKGSNWIVTEGLKAGDKVVVDGTMAVAMSGAKKVQTKEWQPAEAAASAPAGKVQAASEPRAASAAK